MKKIFLCLLLLVSGVLKAQVIENPTFKARNGSIRNITRIERTPQYTKIYIHAIFRPRWWIMEEGDNYLEDAVTGKHYAQTGIEGIELNKKVFMPDSGEMDFVMLFEPLSKEIRSIHLISPGSDEYNTYDISLVPSAPRQKSPLEQVEGNWFTHDAQGRWTYGIHDSIVILNNRFYTTVECKKKGKRLTLTARERTDGSIATLLLTPDKDGSCLIAPYAGKLLFIDFWGTTCAPCRAGIQNTAHLREAYRNHPEFQFVYITGESESPEKDYTMYVEKHLKGEACYRLTDTEYKYMRQLFRFNGIPHYVVVEKDGSISTENVGTHELADFLKRRLDSGKQATAPSDDNPHTQL